MSASVKKRDRACFAYGCHTGYPTCKDKYSTFQVPKDPLLFQAWQMSIPRDNLQAKSVVCEKHFHKSDIIRYIELKAPNGRVIQTAQLRAPRLRRGAVPVLNFDVPKKVLKKKTPTRRKSYASPNERIKKAIETQTTDTITTMEEPRAQTEEPTVYIKVKSEFGCDEDMSESQCDEDKSEFQCDEDKSEFQCEDIKTEIKTEDEAFEICETQFEPPPDEIPQPSMLITCDIKEEELDLDEDEDFVAHDSPPPLLPLSQPEYQQHMEEDDPLFISDEFLAKHGQESTVKIELYKKETVQPSNYVGDVSTDSGYICHICSVPLAEVTELKSHLIVQHRTPLSELMKMDILSDIYLKYTCKTCNIRFAKREDFRTHNRELHPFHARYRCEQCDFTSSRGDLYRRHTRDFHTVVTCIVCKETFDNVGLLSLHKHKEHESVSTIKQETNAIYQCDSCAKQWISSRNLYSHNLPTPCKYCHVIFTPKCELHKHVEQEHRSTNNESGIKLFNCEKCSTDFTTVNAFIQHQKLNHKRFYCKHCFKIFRSGKTFRKHMMGHRNRIAYNCTECPYQSYYKHELKQHQHVAHRPYEKCSFCKFETKSKSILENHERYHKSGKLLFTCDICSFVCDSRGSILIHLKGHLRFHNHKFRNESKRLRSTKVVFEATRNKDWLLKRKKMIV